MSKRKESKRTAKFVLEPDGFSIHTFELSKRLTRHEYHQTKDRLYQIQISEGQTVIYQESKGRHCCVRFRKYGMRIYLEHHQGETGSDTYYVRMVVNPRVLIEPGCSYLGILPPDESSIKGLKQAFKNCLPIPYLIRTSITITSPGWISAQISAATTTPYSVN